MWSPSERRQPDAALPGWPFDAVLFVLVGMQLVILTLWVTHVARHGFWRADTLVGLVLVGVNSGYSAIVVAHELIHRAEAHMTKSWMFVSRPMRMAWHSARITTLSQTEAPGPMVTAP